MAPRILVTGGAGFIGSHLVRHLLAAGLDGEPVERVTIYDALTYAGRRETIADVLADPRARFVRGDVCDRTDLRAAMAGHDHVAHLAAETHVDRSIVGPDVFVRTNCDGTNVVLDTARELSVRRILHASTDEVYGPIDGDPCAEDAPMRPSSPYAASKAGADLLAQSYVTTHGLPVVISRGANTYGPFQFPEKVVPLFTTRLLDGEAAPLYGDGLQQRDWLHVVDTASALAVLLARGEAGVAYNVASGEQTTNRDLAGRLVRLTGRDEALVRPVTDRPGHDRRYAMQTERMRALGWAPTHPLDDGLAATVEWYRSNEWWWRPLVAGSTGPG